MKAQNNPPDFGENCHEVLQLRITFTMERAKNASMYHLVEAGEWADCLGAGHRGDGYTIHFQNKPKYDGGWVHFQNPNSPQVELWGRPYLLQCAPHLQWRVGLRSSCHN